MHHIIGKSGTPELPVCNNVEPFQLSLKKDLYLATDLNDLRFQVVNRKSILILNDDKTVDKLWVVQDALDKFDRAKLADEERDEELAYLRYQTFLDSLIINGENGNGFSMDKDLYSLLTDNKLIAYYRSASLLKSLSERYELKNNKIDSPTVQLIGSSSSKENISTLFSGIKDGLKTLFLGNPPTPTQSESVSIVDMICQSQEELDEIPIVPLHLSTSDNSFVIKEHQQYRTEELSTIHPAVVDLKSTTLQMEEMADGVDADTTTIIPVDATLSILKVANSPAEIAYKSLQALKENRCSCVPEVEKFVQDAEKLFLLNYKRPEIEMEANAVLIKTILQKVGQMQGKEEYILTGKMFKTLLKDCFVTQEFMIEMISDWMYNILCAMVDVYHQSRFLTCCLPTFLLSVFTDQLNFNWLLQLAKPLENVNVQNSSIRMDFIRTILCNFRSDYEKDHPDSLEKFWEATDESLKDLQIEQSIIYQFELLG